MFKFFELISTVSAINKPIKAVTRGFDFSLPKPEDNEWFIKSVIEARYTKER